MKLEGLPLGEIRVHRNSRKKVNGSPRKLALLWARSDSRTVCRLFKNRTGNAHQPSRRSLPDATGLQRWWRDAFFFLPPLLYRLMPIFNFVAVFPWIFLSWQFVYTVVCSLSLLCSSVFYIVNMYNCLSFVLWKKKVFFVTTTHQLASFYRSFSEDSLVYPSGKLSTLFAIWTFFLITQGISQFTMHGFWVVWQLPHITALHFLFPYKIRPEFVTHWRCYVRFSFRLSHSPHVS